MSNIEMRCMADTNVLNVPYRIETMIRTVKMFDNNYVI